MVKGAWVTLATNDSYSLGALVLAHSLKQVGTKQDLAILLTPGVTNSMRGRLAEVFNVVKEVNILDSKDKANLKLLQRPELGITFTKLHCWQLTEYEKCVFLDADTLVLQNCDELFEREELSAAPDVGWPDCFNSGVFVYRPSLETYNSLITFALDKGSFDGGDQGLLNSYFSDWSHKDISKHLPFIYNVCSTAFYSYLPAFKQFGKNVKIIHFIGNAKPWLQYFDTETRSVRPSRDLGHLDAILQVWWNIFCSMIHPNLSSDMSGLAGAFARLTLGQQRTPEQEALEDSLRRQNWEQGNIDYLGRDSFDNIWSKICETLSKGPQEVEENSTQIRTEDSQGTSLTETTSSPEAAVPPPSQEVSHSDDTPKDENSQEKISNVPIPIAQPSDTSSDSAKLPSPDDQIPTEKIPSEETTDAPKSEVSSDISKEDIQETPKETGSVVQTSSLSDQPLIEQSKPIIPGKIESSPAASDPSLKTSPQSEQVVSETPPVTPEESQSKSTALEESIALKETVVAPKETSQMKSPTGISPPIEGEKQSAGSPQSVSAENVIPKSSSPTQSSEIVKGAPTAEESCPIASTEKICSVEKSPSVTSSGTIAESPKLEKSTPVEETCALQQTSTEPSIVDKIATTSVEEIGSLQPATLKSTDVTESIKIDQSTLTSTEQTCPKTSTPGQTKELDQSAPKATEQTCPKASVPTETKELEQSEPTSIEQASSLDKACEVSKTSAPAETKGLDQSKNTSAEQTCMLETACVISKSPVSTEAKESVPSSTEQTCTLEKACVTSKTSAPPEPTKLEQKIEASAEKTDVSEKVSVATATSKPEHTESSTVEKPLPVSTEVPKEEKPSTPSPTKSTTPPQSMTPQTPTASSPTTTSENTPPPITAPPRKSGGKKNQSKSKK